MNLVMGGSAADRRLVASSALDICSEAYQTWVDYKLTREKGQTAAISLAIRYSEHKIAVCEIHTWPTLQYAHGHGDRA